MKYPFLLFLLFLFFPLFAQENEYSFPMLWEESRNGIKTYFLSLEKRDYRELTDIFYTGFLGERRWIGPDDIILEYEILEESPTKTNQYKSLVWYIPSNSGYMVGLRILSDKYRQEDKEWEKEPDTRWREIGHLSSLRSFQRLLRLHKEITVNNPPKIEPISFPFIFDIDKNGNKKQLYSLEKVKPEEILNNPFLIIEGKIREIRPDDLFLEYDVLETNNWYHCYACFTNNAGDNSFIFVRVIQDAYWEDGKQWEEKPDTTWRNVGYLDEIPTFIHLIKAYRKHIEPFEK